MAKTFTQVSLALALSGVLLSVSAEDLSAGTPPEPPVVLNYWASTESPALDQVYAQMCKDYEDAHPGVRIHLTMMSNSSDAILKKMDDARGGKEAEADLVMLSLFALGDRAARGELFSLENFMKAWPDKSDFTQSALELGKYRGQLMGIGYYPTPELFVYRKDYFTQAGLDPLSPPKTWEEITDAAERLTVRDASGKVIRAGFDIPEQSAHLNHFEPFLRMNGVKIIDPLTEVIDIDSSEAVEAAEWIIALKNKNISIPFSIAKYDVPFLRGQAAISQVKNTNLVALFKAEPGLREKVGFMPVPSRKTVGAFTAYKVLSLMKQSKHPEEAWKFLQFVMSRENVWKRYVAYGIVPVRKSLQEQFIAEDPEFHRRVLEYIDLGQGKPVVSFISSFYGLAGPAWEKMYRGEKKPAEALREVREQQQRALKM